MLVHQLTAHRHAAAALTKLDVDDLDRPGERVPRADGLEKADAFQLPARHHGPVAVDGLHGEPLQDREGVDATGDHVAEVAVLCRSLVGVEPLVVPAAGKLEQLGALDQMLAELDAVAHGEIVGEHGRARRECFL